MSEPELKQFYDEETGEITINPGQGYTKFRITASCKLMEENPDSHTGEDDEWNQNTK